MNLIICTQVLFLVTLLFSQFTVGSKLEFQDIVFTIISQENQRHEQKALKIKNEINKDTNFSSAIYLSHINLKHIGDWTILPILPIIWKKHKQKFSWIFFCTDETKVDSLRLKQVLESYNSDVMFVGRGLHDNEPTIIHHFASATDFQYPLFYSGFAMHFTLFEKLVLKLNDQNIIMNMQFSIDASHELALFIQKHSNGQQLVHSPFFCIDFKKNCATSIRNNFICNKPHVGIKNIFFAVKTCFKFHKDRIPVVQKTWAEWTYHIKYFSNVHDKNIPTVQLKVPNVEHGHCEKTQEIIKEIKKIMDENQDIKWAVICDDDTIFSVYRLQELLGCYNHTEPLAIGERYGYNLLSNFGYNYLTGGGGVILSRKAIMKFSHETCKCPSNSTPDDMFLFGICLHELNITMVHIPLFHQARPSDYNSEYLLVGPPISFHKHWMINPEQVYKDWFQLSDILSSKSRHTEL